MSSAVADPVPSPQPVKPKRARRVIKWILLIVLILIVLLVALIVGVLWYFHIPSNSAGLAAQSVCSGTFVGGRNPQDVYEQDVLPQSPALALVKTDVDAANKTVTAQFLGIISRTASFATDRGCVLDIAPDGFTAPYVAPPNNPAPWPQGDAAIPQDQWGAGVNAAGLNKVVDDAFMGAGDPNAGNARAVAVVYKDKLLTEKVAPGFGQTAPQLGWSMTKTVNAMLFYMKAREVGLDLNTKVVDAFPADKAPDWVSQWQQDDRKNITINDLLYMRAGLDNGDDYGPLGKVVQMLYGEPSMADFAASQPLVHQPGTYWEYSTGDANILSQIAQARFATDKDYWQYPKQALFDPIGVTSGTMTTDTSGTWVGGSYLWANATDWARLGQFMMNDGKWNGKQILPPGWLSIATTPAMPDSDGHGYGAQTWMPGDPIGGECKGTGVPADTMSMEGHYGQLVAMIPSKQAVIVRLGWTINSDQFDSCKLISDVVANLPK